MTVIGDYILYWVGEPRHIVGSLCHMYLVAWKEGWVSEVCLPTLSHFIIMTTKIYISAFYLSGCVQLVLFSTIKGDNPTGPTP
jgi:hypothetical protein